MYSLSLYELIEHLQTIAEEHPELGHEDINMSSDYGDHCHHEQVNNAGTVEVIDLCRMAYSSTGWGVADPDDDHAEDRTKRVVIRCSEFVE